MKFSLATALALLSVSATSLAVPLTAEKRNNGDGQINYPAAATGQYLDPTGNTSVVNPQYRALSDFDYASFNLGLYQEWIELDLFHYGIAAFSQEQWQEIGVGPEYLFLLNFMANQETGHAQLLSNILGPGAAKQCTYNYTGAFSDPRSYVDFNQRLTRWGESGVFGFLSRLNSRDSAQLLTQSIATESRQQMVFRQFSGAFPMPVFFETGIPQAWSWTLLQKYIASCPPENPRVKWSIFPELRIENNPALAQPGSQAAVSTNRTALTTPGQQFTVNWDAPGQPTGPDQSYTTSINTTDSAQYAILVQQLNATYVPLFDVNEQQRSASFFLPDLAYVYNNSLVTGDPIFNGTGFVALVSDNPYLTPNNLSLINKYVVAGPAIIQFG